MAIPMYDKKALGYSSSTLTTSSFPREAKYGTA
jgi:hypothetical protein